MNDHQQRVCSTVLQRFAGFAVTTGLWIYYICGYLFFFSAFYLFAFFFSRQREESFQRLNWRLHRLFFAFLRMIVPGVAWQVADDVAALRSSIIIANHRSFLDPILLVSLYEKQKTIVKGAYFRLPVFGWILRQSGYIPSPKGRPLAEDRVQQVMNIRDYLASGGNLFIFPEGTRSKSGAIGPFDKGAFSIARLCRAPLAVVVIRNTDKLYPPGRLLFNACSRSAIKVELAGILKPDYGSPNFSLSVVMAEARLLMERKMER